MAGIRFVQLLVAVALLLSAAPSVLYAQSVPSLSYMDATPNPMEVGGSTRIQYELYDTSDSRESVVQVYITDYGVQNRLRTFHGPEPRSVGFHSLTWDGRDDAGSVVPKSIVKVFVEVERDGLTPSIHIPLYIGEDPPGLDPAGSGGPPPGEGSGPPPGFVPALPQAYAAAADSNQPGTCRDPWVTQAVEEVVGRSPDGYADLGECDYLRYGRGSWNSYPDLLEKVHKTFGEWGTCLHADVTRAVSEVTGRAPVGYDLYGECDHMRYGLGNWDSYQHLVTNVRVALSRPGICRDPWVTQALTQVLGRPPEGSGDEDECDYRRYGGGSWNSYDDLLSKVRAAVVVPGVCRDAWVTQAIGEVLGRAPEGSGDEGECDYHRYGGGSWNSYPDLVEKVRAAYGGVRRILSVPEISSATRDGMLVFDYLGTCAALETQLPDDGIPLRLRDCDSSSPTQKLRYDPVNAMLYIADKCVQPIPGNPAAAPGAVGDLIGGYNCTGAAPQKWHIDGLGRVYGINNLCFEAGLLSDAIRLEACSGGELGRAPSLPKPAPPHDGQRWTFKAPTYGIIATYEPGIHKVSRCLDRQSWDANTPLVSDACHGGNSQMFKVGTDGTIKAFPYSDLCLDGRDGRDRAAMLRQCDGSPDQRWDTDRLPGLLHTMEYQLQEQLGGTLRNQANGLCIDIKGENLDPGAPVILWDCFHRGGESRPWNQTFGVGTVRDSLRALIFQRDTLPYFVGHSAWAIEMDDGRWLAGGWDGIDPHAWGTEGSGTVGYMYKGADNGHWKLVFNTKEEVVAWFAGKTVDWKGPGGQDRVMPYQKYQRYKEITVRNANTAAVFSLEAQSWTWGYGVFANNCMNVTYDLLVAFNEKSLPWPNILNNWAPRWWFENIGASEVWL